MKKRTNGSILIVVAVGALGTGCKSKTSDASQSSQQRVEQPKREPARRAALAAFRPLLDEVGRAELDVGGIAINFGTPDQHKYTRGGWRSGWGATTVDGETSALVLSSRRGFLEVPAPRSPVSAIVVRARSRSSDQRLTWFAGDRELGTTKLGKAWSVVRVPIDADEIPTSGLLRLEARASASAVGGARAELDWLWLASGEGDEPLLGPRVLPIEIDGTTRRTLAAPTPRTYAFYVQPPPKAHFVVDLGASGAAEFAVTATTDDGKRVELLRDKVERAWKEHAVSLAPFAGRAVRLELTTTEQNGAVGWGEPELRVDRAAAPKPALASGSAPRNVIVLVLDTARADSFGPFAGPDRVVRTPAFDELAGRSAVFTRAYNNENWTKPSVATTLSGLYPTTHDTKEDASKLSSDVELVSERLQRDGFATAAFIANGYVSKAFGFDQGWDVLRNYIRESRPSEAEHVFGDALAWHAEHIKRRRDQPFFLYLQTIDPHVTYRVDKRYWSPYFEGEYMGPLGSSIEAEDQVRLSSGQLSPTDRDKRWLRALYFGELAYHDAELAKFLAELEKRGVLDDTLIVVTNDHGEELGERGRYGHGHQVFEEMIRAPLIMHYPPLFAAGAQIDTIVEHVDLAPTILDLLGKSPLAAADGTSLVPLLRGQPVQLPSYAMTEFLHGRRVLRVGDWKLFARPEGGGALFDLANDPREKRDLAGTAPVARRLCEIHLGEALATPDKAKRTHGIASRRRFRAGAAKISPQMRRQLEALGYLAGPSPDDPDESDAPDAPDTKDAKDR